MDEPNNTKRIMIMFTRPKGFRPFAWLIRLFERAPYSHVCLGWHSKHFDAYILYEATGSGVNFLGNNSLMNGRIITHAYAMTLTEAQMFEFVRACLYRSGTSYGFFQVLGIAIARIFGLKKNPFSNEASQMVCSELVGLILKEVLGSNMFEGLDLEMAGPRQIDEEIKKAIEKGAPIVAVPKY